VQFISPGEIPEFRLISRLERKRHIMNALFRSLTSVLLAGIVPLVLTAPSHAQMRGRPMSTGMMMSRPVLPQAQQLAVMQQMRMSMMQPTMSTNSTAQLTASQLQTLRNLDALRQRRWWWQWHYPYYGMGYGYPYYGMGYGYGGYDGYGNYGSGYTPTYSPRYDREYQPEQPARPRTNEDVLEHSLNNPSSGEILSGQALNNILADLSKRIGQANSEIPPATALAMTQAELAHINLSRGAGSIALLKRGDRMNWPEALSGPDDQEVRDRVATLLHNAIEQARSNGRVEQSILAQLETDVGQVQRQLPRIARNSAADAYFAAKAFVTSLDAAVTALRQPDVRNFFNGQYDLKPGPIPDVMRWLTERGLRFATALPGDEGAYTTLHRELAAYDRALRGNAAPPARPAGDSGSSGPYGAMNIP
jgi:hypothetical protein